jgi:hypothetical protein
VGWMWTERNEDGERELKSGTLESAFEAGQREAHRATGQQGGQQRQTGGSDRLDGGRTGSL